MVPPTSTDCERSHKYDPSQVTEIGSKPMAVNFVRIMEKKNLSTRKVEMTCMYVYMYVCMCVL